MEDRARLDSRELLRAWQGVLGRLELELNPHNFTTWLAPTRARSFDGNDLVVEARSAMACDWLDRRMRTVVERAAAQAFGGEVHVTFVACGESRAEVPPESLPVVPERSHSGAVIGTVNCAFTFEDYLATDGNRLALQACVALVEPSDLVASPVVLFGSPGLGKTHLLHALACRARDLGRNVACLSAEEFTNRFLGAMRAKRAEEFQAEVRGVQLLIIDDLQSIAGKKATQDELVWTIDAVTNAGGHVVVASERHPFELGLLERLESRLAAGIITRMEPFDWSERRVFIEAVARKKRGGLPGWAIDRLAGVNAPSVRVLLGCVNAALGLERAQQLDMRTLDASLAGVAVVEKAATNGSEQQLLERVAQYFGVACDDLVGRARSTRLSEARAVAAAGLQARGYSLPRIGSLLSGRDKGTISALARRGREMIEEQDLLEHLIAG
ncbi:MAG: DnaA/Hda family protein [Dehalococcoidia bacterium]